MLRKLTPENYLFLALECERLTMLNRSLVSENQQLSYISQQKVQELLNVNQQLNEEIVKLKADVTARDTKSIEVLLSRMDQEIEKREKAIESLKKDLEKKDQEAKELNSSSSKLSELDNQVANLKRDKESAESSLIELRTKYTGLENEYWGLRSEIQGRLPFLETEVERLSKEKQAKEHHIEQLVIKLDEINAIEDKTKLYDENRLLKTRYVIVCAELERIKEKNQNLEDIIAEWLGAKDRGLIKFDELTSTTAKTAKDLLGDPWIALVTADDAARNALEAHKLVSQTTAQIRSAEIRVFDPSTQEVVSQLITAESNRPQESNQNVTSNVEENRIVESSSEIAQNNLGVFEKVEQAVISQANLLGGEAEEVRVVVEFDVFSFNLDLTYNLFLIRLIYRTNQLKANKLKVRLLNREWKQLKKY